ncbi:cytochrome c maturation protein CcmE [Chloroflexota bacterium]
MFKRKKFIIGGFIIFLAIAALAYTGYNDSATYYYTVSEVFEKAPISPGQGIRVNGNVENSVLDKSGGDRVLTFDITEGGKSLEVEYRGVVPDAFQDDIDAVVEGKLTERGVFEADSIMVKCPSKYVPENE